MLFIDTETTGIPLDWSAPYSDRESWPCSVQVAWAIYSKDGREIKSENFYVRDDTFQISKASIKIHGITQQFLQEHGIRREEVLAQLTADLEAYQPLVVAHFMQLDYHMVAACYERATMPNPLPELPLFCTLLASTGFLLQPHQRYLRLGELYERLFGEQLQNQHNAIYDAKATAKCFFELVQRGDISDDLIEKQEAIKVHTPQTKTRKGCGLSLMAMVLFSILLSYWI